MKRIVAFIVAAAVLVGCSPANPDPAPRSPSPSAQDATGPALVTGPGATGSTEDPRDGLPAPDGSIPLEAPALAREIERTWTALRAEVATWTVEGDPATWPPPESVELLALHEQRIARVLARHQRLAERVTDRLPHRIAADLRANARAGAALFSHSSPLTGPITLRVRRPEPADVLRGYFEEAESRFGVAWEVLAAVMLIETRMGRVVSHSSAGAQGPMQFIPSTWDAYGMGGDVYEERDAILGAANYLRASGAPATYRAALYHYNPLRSYVTAVTQYAKVMMRDPDAYYAYYNWQVFVRTRRGDVRLSGPGL